MELIDKVKEAKKVLVDAQKDLLLWCQDKNTPLNYMSTGSTILSRLLEWWLDKGYIERHQVIDYDYLIEYLCEVWVEGEEYENRKDNEIISSIINKHVAEMRDLKIESVLSGATANGIIITTPTNVDELEIFLKEEILKANFGSTTYDW